MVHSKPAFAHPGSTVFWYEAMRMRRLVGTSSFISVIMVLLISLSSCGGGGGGGGGGNSGGATSSVPTNGTISNFTVGQNGTSTSPWGDGTASDQPAMAVQLTAPSYPVTLTSVTIYASNNTGSDQFFNLYGYSDLTTLTQIFSPMMNQAIPNTGTGHFAETIAIPPTTISSGSFYIVVEWVTKPLVAQSGHNAFFLQTDSHMDHPNTSFMRFTTTWEPLESVSATAGDLGIFASYGSNPISTEPTVVSIIPANGATGVDRNIQTITVQFDKEMDGRSSVLGDTPNWPLSGTTPISWSSDQKTFQISRDNAATPLPALTTITVRFNPAGYNPEFMDIFGNTLNAYTLSFTTGP